MLQGFSLQYLHFQTVSSPLHLQWAISAGETSSILKPYGLLWPLETPASGHPLKDML